MRFLFLLFTAITATAGDSVRVLSFNLRYLNSSDTGDKAWTARRDDVAALIKKDAADFVGTQEAFRQMLDDVRERAPGYGEIGVGRDDGKTKGEYSAILYRTEAWEAKASGTFWLSDTPEVPGSCSWGNKVTRVCTWGHFRSRSGPAEVFVFNAHLDHESQPARERSTALILQRIRSLETKAPVIVTGDFNAAPDNPAVKTMLAGPPAFTDAWLALHKDAKPADSGTFHAFSGRRDGSRIDYIFAGPGVTPLEAAILNEARDNKWPSDHYPVRATLRLP
jgi:endonuclease/exonuclease/phosphatase family metal-dependent hydrolase